MAGTEAGQVTWVRTKRRRLCPRCRCEPDRYTEVVEMHAHVEARAGERSDDGDAGNHGAFLRVMARCGGCEYTWRVRGVRTLDQL